MTNPGGGVVYLRTAALIAALVGAVGSSGFLLRAGQQPPRLLLVIMLLWVITPYIALGLADMVSKRWPVLVRQTIYSIMVALTLGSLAAYVEDALRPRKAQAAFVFVVVPLVSWIVIVIAVPIAALISRSRSRRVIS